MHRVAAAPVQEIPRFAFNAPWAEGFDGDVFMRTVGLVILVAAAILYFIAELKKRLFPGQIPENQGARLLLNDIILPAARRTPAVRDRFEGADWAIMPFVMQKAVYLYAYGKYRNEPLPDFFKQTTRDAIEQIRNAGWRDEISERLEALFATFEDYETGMPRIELRAAVHNVSGQIVQAANMDAMLENQEAIDALKDLPGNIEDLNIRQFQFCKIIYRFAYGRDRLQEVPELLTRATRAHIQGLRNTAINQEVSERVEALFENRENYLVEEPFLEIYWAAHRTIQAITVAANNEYHNSRNSYFMNTCWPVAVGLLPPAPVDNAAQPPA